jgi:predicted Zn-dependent protease
MGTMIPKRFFLFLACALLATYVPAGAANETAIGAQVYQDLAKKGAIVDASPWYAVLNQMGAKIATIANKRYAYPFRFFLVKEAQPNAFAVPGGNIYVTLPMMTFVKTKEELAGVLCHEVAHDIHGDVPALNQKAQTTGAIAMGLSLLIGGGKDKTVNAILGTGAKLQGATYSRAVEQNADTGGAQICAQSGYNPWGMVWLFQTFAASKTTPTLEMLQDHPNDANRIATLENLFRNNPATYGRFNRNRSSGNAIPSLASLQKSNGNVRPTAPAKRPGY